MSKILALETATEACSAALLHNDYIIEQYQLAPRQHTKLILPMVQTLLAEAAISLTQLDAIAFGCGPGSFTGVRIAASVTQGLAFGADLPVIPISSLNALAQTAYAESATTKVLAAFDARMQEVYWGMYRLADNQLMQAVSEDSLSKPENITIPKDQGWTGVGDGWATYPDNLSKKVGIKLTDIRAQLYPHAQAVAKLALPDYLANKTLPADKALPVYLRSVL